MMTSTGARDDPVSINGRASPNTCPPKPWRFQITYGRRDTAIMDSAQQLEGPRRASGGLHAALAAYASAMDT